MRAVLPGKPNPQPQVLATGYWESRHVTAYISGNAIAILSDPQTLVQTIYDGDEAELQALAFDEASGKIAVCTASVVRIYSPVTHEDGELKWNLESLFKIESPSDSPTSLSWGGSQELLVGTGQLALYTTSASPPTKIWSKTLPNPVRLALVSYDSAYIATVGHYDPLVKIWRRLTYGSEEVRFDLAYLSHPDLVTRIQWRKPYHVDQTSENVLYTFCVDNVVRIWTGSDTHAGQQLHLWGSVDLSLSLQDSALNRGAVHATKWAFMIDVRDFAAAAEHAVQTRPARDDPARPQSRDKDDMALDHFIEIANKNPEICVILSASGIMSAWALENVGCGSHSSATIFNVAHIRAPEFDFPTAWDEHRREAAHVQIENYCDRQTGLLNLIVHYVDGRVEVYQADMTNLFNPAASSERLSLSAVWSGHSGAIRKMVRNYSGRALVSRTADGETLVWKHAVAGGPRWGFRRQSLVPVKGRIRRMCVLRKGRFVVLLREDSISLWDCRRSTAILLDERPYNLPGNPLCLLILPRQRIDEYAVAHIATVTSERKGVVWELQLPHYADERANPAAAPRGSVREFCDFGLEDAEGLAYVLPVDPAGSTPVVSGFLDVFARDVAISYTHSGRVDFWTVRVDPDSKSVGWLSTSSTETGISEPALVSGSTLKKAALVNATRSQVSIWDIGGARLEYAEDFEAHNVIKDLDWTSTPDSQSILAVGYQYRVVLLCQMRFDYLNEGPAWAPIREISIRDLTPHPIGDSTWLGDGHLVIGSGNQLFVNDRRFELPSSLAAELRSEADGKCDMFEVVQRLNGPLPVFHPQFLSQCILSGKTVLVQSILVALHRTLRYHVEGDALDNYLDLDLELFYTSDLNPITSSREELNGFFTRRQSFETVQEAFTEEMAHEINEKLTRISISQLSGREQMQLADLVECAGAVESQRRSLDENGARFMLFFRQHALRTRRRRDVAMSWREINWAFHSTSQDMLVDFVAKQAHGNILWQNAKDSGMFMWLTDQNAVRAQFENIARNEYTRNDPKDPIACSLFYLALRKKTVLQGLWRMASWHKEQVATQRLLANDFSEKRWRTTALKNAYALLGKHRYMYAAAFFLLADRLQDAVGVCAEHLNDLQLAIAVARVYEGDNGPVLNGLLEGRVLGLAAQEGNRWMACWAFWMLKRKDMAVRALINPIYTLVETPSSPDIQSRLFLTDDPALVVLYGQLRHQTLQTLRGASKVTPRAEWQFVLHSAKLYDRMGCDMLGLELVRNWSFPLPVAPTSFHNDVDPSGQVNPLRLLGRQRRSSLVVADLPMRSGGTTEEIAGPTKAAKGAPVTVFQEPDANSLLDSFGF